MTALPFPKQLAEINLADHQAIATCPAIVSSSDTFVNATSYGMQGSYTFFQNLFSGLAFTLVMDCEVVNALAGTYQHLSLTKSVLSKDKKFCYTHGSNNAFSAPPNDWNMASKINIATNEIVWLTEDPDAPEEPEDPKPVHDPTTIAIDNDENVLISSVIFSGVQPKTHLLNGQTGVIIDSTAFRAFHRMVVDSSGYIYGVQGPDRDDLAVNVHKMNPDLTDAVAPVRVQADANKRCSDCVLNAAEDVLFVIGERNSATPPYYNLWALDPTDLSELGKSDILGNNNTGQPRMFIMPDDSLRIVDAVTDEVKYVTYSAGTFTEVTTGNWPITGLPATAFDIYKGPFNYIFVISETGISIYTPEGVFVRFATIVQRAYGLLFPGPQKAIYMNQTMEPENWPATPADSIDFTELDYPDMCCFLNDEIPEYDASSTYAIDDLVWNDGFDSYKTSPDTSFFANTQTMGTWKVIETIGTPKPFFENFSKMKRISTTIPCQNANWDQYTGFGGQGVGGLIVGGVNTGIGNSPQFYTISLFGMADVGGVNYNGNYLIKRIPGMFGAFAGYNPTTNLQINFNIQSQLMPTRDSSGGVNHPADHYTKIRVYLPASNTPDDIFDYVEDPGDDDQIWVIGNKVAKYNQATDIIIEDSSTPANNGTYTYKSANFDGTYTRINIEEGSITDYGATSGTIKRDADIQTLIFQADLSASNWNAGGGGPPSYPGDPFAYHHDASPTNISNELGGVGGTGSLYPGRYEEWDTTTIFVVGQIVAHEGFFYQADNQNQNSEPPSGDWTQISGPV